MTGYSTVLFIGTIEEAEKWIAGIEWARQYYGPILNVLNDGDIEIAEQNIRDEQVRQILAK